jgi:hypothetical protein
MTPTTATLPRQALHSLSDSSFPVPEKATLGGNPTPGFLADNGADLTNLKHFIAQNFPFLDNGGNQSLGTELKAHLVHCPVYGYGEGE